MEEAVVNAGLDDDDFEFEWVGGPAWLHEHPQATPSIAVEEELIEYRL